MTPLETDSQLPSRAGETAPRSGFVSSASARTAALEAVQAAVRADAAKQWQVEPAALSVHTEAVTWADGAIGCPTPGVMYTQALVPGWRLTVSDGARQFIYHASRRGAWTWCPPQRATPPLPDSATR